MAKDPYKYFRVEARELLEGLTQGVLQLEKGAPAPDLIARLLRLAHTLKGAARVVKQSSIAELSHTMESVLTNHRGIDLPLGKEQASSLLRCLDQMAALVNGLEPASEAPVKRDAAIADEPLETVRVDIEKMDTLVRIVADTTAHVGAVRRDLGTMERLRDMSRLLTAQLAPQPGDDGGSNRARALADELRGELDHLVRALTTDAERVEGGLADIQDITQRLRLIPAHTVFPLLDRAVRDAAQELGKDVDFEASGGDVRLDAQVLASVRDALMHVVRNAVTHGVEAAAVRKAVGKPARGQVRLTVERRGGRVAFVCRDDGAGIDIAAVRRVAVARGLMREAQASSASADELLDVLRTGAFTTQASVTELSGRGIGLDVLRAMTARLKGESTIRSDPGQGATFEMLVPISIASLQGLVVEFGGVAVTIPLDAVRETLRLAETDIARAAGSSSILHAGKVIPFVPLERALRRPGPSSKRRRAWSAVVVEANNRGVAVGVDRLLGTTNIVMRALPDMVAVDPVIAGATLDGEGNPQLVLDPAGLVRYSEQDAGRVTDQAETPRAPVLVIDDSLTTRMLEQSILESAGYQVELATSAEEGLVKARNRRYSLFIVDVEMPGMDGFAFVAATQADPTLRDTAAILVTSRNAPEDKRRGTQVGARAYIVKGEFDQGALLTAIQRLIAGKRRAFSSSKIRLRCVSTSSTCSQRIRISR